ncbi:LOW QUALITY PROTEIN: fasciclin-like arabinogalactan protein 3 [Durio zibethinus]|uniref:LOW QUALITY PROTEIN: fasciclin-like arabinogalactan protein 3 n=1 Tax=Durio zibethinus TaxID=66656 RepID=A0A6P5ZD34_DURZI|nr:LOW QUALITY PROTEIN: fasciclin-like arabinogalactan protein 3 [Durio zibethinus]
MAAKAFLLFVIAFFFLALSTTTSSAFNITKVLGQYPEYGTFNNLLSQTKLAEQISHRQTITILALDNDTISSIANRSTDELKKILMNHIILDYFDTLKIQKLGKKSAILTTLYQTTGMAMEQQGFLNLTRIGPGDVAFGSGVKGAPLVSKLLGSVVAQPFNLSVLHVSTPIVAPGFGDPVLAPPPPPGSKPPAPAPKKAEAPAPSEEEEGDDEGESPDGAPSPAPSADAPAADAPTKGKSPPSPKDADEEEEAEAPAPSASSKVVGSRIAAATVIGLVASFVAF